MIIGPEPNGLPDPFTRGLAAESGVLVVALENVTIQNVLWGINFSGNELYVRNCVFRGCDQGVSTFALNRTLVEGCLFEDHLDAGVIVFGSRGSTGVEIVHSSFVNNLIGIDLQTQGNVVRDCTFNGGVVGIQFSFGGSGTISRCTIDSPTNVGIGLINGSRATLTNNVVIGGMGNLIVTNYGHAIGTGNEFRGGSFSALRFGGQATAELHENHILSDPGLAVTVASFSGDGHTIDLTDNYWGLMTAQEIADSITDSEDDPTITGTVIFEPFVGQPIATGSSSFGTLKARFGHQQDDAEH